MEGGLAVIQNPRRSAPADCLPRAGLFLSQNARLLERLRFEFLFGEGSAEPVLLALRGYQNADGGFGHALEPDLRGVESEPIPAWTALGILDELHAMRGPTLATILRYVAKAEVAGGGLPFVLPAASRSPHAPWWETGPGKVRGSLNPTAGIAAYLYKNRIRTPWLSHASAWCWDRVDRLREANPYELRVILAFLDWSPDRKRAGETIERLRPLIRAEKVVELDASKESEAFRPLDFAPNPGLLSSSVFSEQEISDHLDRIVWEQRPDGGWGVNFPIWTPITRFEWEGCQTLEMLKILRANRRLLPS
jgi:hypothetical protein